MNRGLGFRLLAVGLGLAFGIGAVECALRTLDLGPWSRIPRPNTVDPTMEFHVHHPDPEVGWALRPGASGVFQGSTLRVNGRGCRGAELAARSEVDLRIVALGDSITFGAGVEEAETFEAQLQARLDRPGRRAEVLNCGVSGYNLVQSLRRYEVDLADLRPDVIVVGLFVDDLTAPYRMQDDSLASRLRGRSAAWRAFELGGAWAFGMGLRDLPPWAEDDAAYRRVGIERFAVFVAAREAEGVEVVAVVHPPLMDLTRAPGLKAHPELFAAAAAAPLVVSMEPVYRAVVGDDLAGLSILPETEDPHPSASGHLLVAEALAPVVDGGP